MGRSYKFLYGLKCHCFQIVRLAPIKAACDQQVGFDEEVSWDDVKITVALLIAKYNVVATYDGEDNRTSYLIITYRYGTENDKLLWSEERMQEALAEGGGGKTEEASKLDKAAYAAERIRLIVDAVRSLEAVETGKAKITLQSVSVSQLFSAIQLNFEDALTADF